MHWRKVAILSAAAPEEIKSTDGRRSKCTNIASVQDIRSRNRIWVLVVQIQFPNFSPYISHPNLDTK